MVLYLLLCLVGFLLLCFGASWLVKGSSSLARSLGVAPIVIGLTVVAFGTSAPELVVSLVSAIAGKGMIAVGNVVGSNICNIALVLGAAAILHPLVCHRSVARRDVPIMLLVSGYLFLLCLDDTLGRGEGITLLAGLVIYTFYNYRSARAGGRAEAAHVETEVAQLGAVTSRRMQILLILAGIAGVVGGAKLVVDAAVEVMHELGVDEKFIGLTIVAFGTSLPELATSVTAALRREMDISIGNLVGSNVFNILSVLGASALVRPIPIPGGFLKSGLVVDYGVMAAVSTLPMLFLWRGSTVRRRHGLLLLACYAGYLAWLISRT